MSQVVSLPAWLSLARSLVRALALVRQLEKDSSDEIINTSLGHQESKACSQLSHTVAVAQSEPWSSV